MSGTGWPKRLGQGESAIPVPALQHWGLRNWDRVGQGISPPSIERDILSVEKEDREREIRTYSDADVLGCPTLSPCPSGPK